MIPLTLAVLQPCLWSYTRPPTCIWKNIVLNLGGYTSEGEIRDAKWVTKTEEEQSVFLSRWSLCGDFGPYACACLCACQCVWMKGNDSGKLPCGGWVGGLPSLVQKGKRWVGGFKHFDRKQLSWWPQNVKMHPSGVNTILTKCERGTQKL